MSIKGKLLVVGILLLVCGVYVVFTAPLSVEAGHIAVVHSKIFGIGTTIYDARGINWVWTRLIPCDSATYVFPEGQTLTRYTLDFILPPGELPGLHNTDDFFCSLEFSFTWYFTRTSLPILISSGITSKDALVERALDRIEPLIRHALVDETERALAANRLPDLVRASAHVIENEARPLLEEFLSGKSVALIQFDAYWNQLPDPARYARMRTVLQEADRYLIEYIRDWRRTGVDIDRKERENKQEQSRLENIAKIVTEYPELINYFAVTGLSDKIRLAILPLNNGASEAALGSMMQQIHQSLLTNIQSIARCESEADTNGNQ